MSKRIVRASVFAALGSDDVAALAHQLQRVTFARGDRVFSQGEAAERLYIIEAGKVKLTRVTMDGRTQLIAVLGPADVLGEVGVVDEQPRSFTATTLTVTTTAAISRAAINALMTERPQIARGLLRLLADRLRHTNDLLYDQTYTDVPGRLAKQLLHLARRFGINEGATLRVNHELTQTDLAHLVGSTRETVNIALVDFTQRGWIRTVGRSVIICDPERLARRANAPVDRRSPSRRN